MKLLVLFFVAAAWLHIPADGYSAKIRSLDFSQFTDRRSIESSSEESSLDLTGMGPSEGVKATLQRMFAGESWRTLILGLASPEVMQDPNFRAKWSITEEDDRMKEEEENEDEDLAPEVAARIEEFFSSRRWKGMMALSSSKDELMDPDYREQWELGDFNVDIEDLDEDGDFFEGPQWRVFLEVTGLKVRDGLNDWMKVRMLMEWLMETGQMMMELD